MSVVRPLRLTNQKHLIREHLLRLDVTDRYLRFCSTLNDSAIERYVEGLDLVHKDVVFGIFDDTTTKVVALLHVAPLTEDSAEFALSVDKTERKQGLGDKLFERGLLHCESVGIKQIYMNCLATNQAIKNMAQKRKMTITTDYGESIAQLDLTNERSVRAFLTSVQSDAVGLYDLNCKYTRRQWDEYVALVKSMWGGRDKSVTVDNK